VKNQAGLHGENQAPQAAAIRLSVERLTE